MLAVFPSRLQRKSRLAPLGQNVARRDKDDGADYVVRLPLSDDARLRISEKTKFWNALQPKEFKRERARRAALAMHAQGKTNTKAATAAHIAMFPTREDMSAHMRKLAAKSAEVRSKKRDLCPTCGQRYNAPSDVSVSSSGS